VAHVYFGADQDCEDIPDNVSIKLIVETSKRKRTTIEVELSTYKRLIKPLWK
jgi:hypothetical protein